MNYIELKGIEKKFNINTSAEVHALRGLDLTVEKGEMLAIKGRSGAGKSTLLHIMGCLDYPTSGTYRLEGSLVNFKSNKDMAFIRNKKIGFVLQQFGSLLDRSAIDNVSIPLIFSSTKLRDIRGKCMKVLGELGIADLAERPVNQLSGGEKQRVAIARAIVNDPDLILADEPTGALDSKTSQEIMEVLKSLNDRGKTIIIVTHDKDVASMCKRVIEIKDGKLI